MTSPESQNQEIVESSQLYEVGTIIAPIFVF
jgi:hypothetical protein